MPRGTNAGAALLAGALGLTAVVWRGTFLFTIVLLGRAFLLAAVLGRGAVLLAAMLGAACTERLSRTPSSPSPPAQRSTAVSMRCGAAAAALLTAVLGRAGIPPAPCPCPATAWLGAGLAPALFRPPDVAAAPRVLVRSEAEREEEGWGELVEEVVGGEAESGGRA